MLIEGPEAERIVLKIYLDLIIGVDLVESWVGSVFC